MKEYQIKIESLDFDLDNKTQQIISQMVKTLYVNLSLNNFNLKILGNGCHFEGILWCRNGYITLGSYNRANSLLLLVQRLLKSVIRENRKINRTREKKYFRDLENNTDFAQKKTLAG